MKNCELVCIIFKNNSCSRILVDDKQIIKIDDKSYTINKKDNGITMATVYNEDESNYNDEYLENLIGKYENSVNAITENIDKTPLNVKDYETHLTIMEKNKKKMEDVYKKGYVQDSVYKYKKITEIYEIEYNKIYPLNNSISSILITKNIILEYEPNVSLKKISFNKTSPVKYELWNKLIKYFE